MSWRSGIKRSLQSKRSFVFFSFWTFGLTFAVPLIWFLGKEGDFAHWFFLGLLAFAGSLLYSHIVWPFARDISQRVGSGDGLTETPVDPLPIGRSALAPKTRRGFAQWSRTEVDP